MGSSKENQEESVLAPLTEIKRLRRALPCRIMEYGISHPAQDSHNENCREICWQPCSRIIHVFLSSSLAIIFSRLKSPSLRSAFLILSSVFALLHLSYSVIAPQVPIFPFFTAKGEQAEWILLDVDANISSMEGWKMNNQPTIQGQQDNSIKEREGGEPEGVRWW